MAELTAASRVVRKDFDWAAMMVDCSADRKADWTVDKWAGS